MANLDKRREPLNQILYGPPGTGKTYSSMDKAVEIIMGEEYSQIINDREKIREKYKEFVKSEQIVFTTFHQSYGYEDFIEGYKPGSNIGDDDDENNSNGLFTLQEGIFKKLCNMSKEIKANKKYDFGEEVKFYKMSLGNTQDSSDDIIYEECIKNNVIALGWGGDMDYSQCKTQKETKELYKQVDRNVNTKRVSMVNNFKNLMKIGDLVFISKGNKKIRTIGKITGEYEYRPEMEIGYNHIRKVQWLYEGEIPIEKLHSKQLSQLTFYELREIKKGELKEIISYDNSESIIKKNYVIIIDEINRGNISKIFGELITLIEEDKRIGGENEITANLPYSKENFGVPSNVYIIGTMNTADRSIALLDTALRRRFVFKEIMPKEDLIADVIEGTKIRAKDIFRALNNRIEALLGRESQIGHSYFMVKNYDEFCDTMLNRVIPLLQEYFYFDMAKVKLVLDGGKKLDSKNTLIIETSLELENFLGKGKTKYRYDILKKEDIKEDIFNQIAFFKKEDIKEDISNQIEL